MLRLFSLFRFDLFAFTEAAALRSIGVRYSICMLPDVAFSEYFCTITVFSLYDKYVVRFSLPDGVFLPCDHGLDF